MAKEFNTHMRIGRRQVGADRPAFIIGEIGSNHNLSLKTAKQLIDAGARAGVDAVKFQSLRFDQQYLPDNQKMQQLHATIDFPEQWLPKLAAHAKKRGVIFMSSPTYLEAIEALKAVRVPAFKIASPQTSGFGTLIQKVAETGLPLVMSTGGCTLEEIDRAVELVQKTGNRQMILLHCVSAYPLEPKHVNLSFMYTLAHRYGCLVGFSDHTMSTATPAVAVALGARVIEKHYTLSRNQKGPDHRFALEPDELAEMVHNIREAEASIGDGKTKRVLPEEKRFQRANTMKLVAGRELLRGQRLQEADVVFRRGNGGIADFELHRWLGKQLKRDVSQLTIIRKQDFA